MFSVHTRPEEFKNTTVTGQFGIVFEETSVTEITWLSWRHHFRKAPFSKCFHPHENEKTGVFKFLRFEERFRKAPFAWRISVDGRPYGRITDNCFLVRGNVNLSVLVDSGYTTVKLLSDFFMMKLIFTTNTAASKTLKSSVNFYLFIYLFCSSMALFREQFIWSFSELCNFSKSSCVSCLNRGTCWWCIDLHAFFNSGVAMRGILARLSSRANKLKLLLFLKMPNGWLPNYQ